MTPTPQTYKTIRSDAPCWLAPRLLEAIDGMPRQYRFALTGTEQRVLRTPKKINVSKWAEKNRILTMSSLPGPWRNHITPYLTDIMDAAAEPYIRTIILCKAPQTGGSEAVHNFIGYAIDRDPGPVMYVYPDEDLSRENGKDRIIPYIQSSPRLRNYLPEGREEFSGKRINLKHMPIYLSWATSPSKLSNKPVKHMVLDETDKYPATGGKREADPISLAEKRLITYEKSCKVWKISTPTTETGYIWQAMTREAQVIFDYHVRCPFCSAYQIMEFKNIRWPEDQRDPEYIETKKTAWYQCNRCNRKWDDAARDKAVAGGDWRTRKSDTVAPGLSIFTHLRSEKPQKIAFHIPSWLSYFVSLSKVAAAFLRGQKDFQKLKDFRNAHQALPWKHLVISTKAEDIFKARCALSPQTVPPAAVALTAGIDNQKYGKWFVVRAWARDYTSWLIHYGMLSTWEDLETLLFETSYPVRDSDRRMRIIRAGLDTGGSEAESGLTMTEEAYMWLRKNGRGRGCRVWGTKGTSHKIAGKLQIGKPRDKTPSGKPLKGGLQIILLNTDELKDMVHYRLNQAIAQEAQAAYLHNATGMDWVNQVILSEEKQRDEKGVESWVPVKRDNHLLDCECICQIVADPEWPTGGIHILRPLATKRPDQPPDSEDIWIRRNRPNRPDWLENR